jgi:hypothetical protein
MYLVADSALYSAENLQKLAETSLKRRSWPRHSRQPWPRC